MLLVSVTRYCAPEAHTIQFCTLYVYRIQFAACLSIHGLPRSPGVWPCWAHRLSSESSTLHRTPHITHISKSPRPFWGDHNRSWLESPHEVIPTLLCIHLKFSLLGCQNALNNQLFSSWFLLVSTGLLIYLIINVHVLYWRLLTQCNLFTVAIPNATNNQEKSPAITKVTALPAEVLFNLTVCKLACSLLHNLFLEAQTKMNKSPCPLFPDSREPASSWTALYVPNASVTSAQRRGNPD